jgi:regulator of replication initiation timing
MKTWLSIGCAALFWTRIVTGAEATEAQQLGILEEKVSRLTAQVEDVQFRQQQTAKEVEAIRAELKELRRVAGGASAEELKALEDRIAAVDLARQKDKQAIVEQLAKELASLGSGKPPVRPPTDAREHTVAKGETLSAIAKSYGVSIADLKKANSLTGDDIKVGQKLAIPK